MLSPSTSEEELTSPRGRTQTMVDSKEIVEDYILLDKLGKGAYGVVYKAVHMSQVSLEILYYDYFNR